MPSSETARAIIFVSLALLGCLIRTYIRTANGEKEDEVHFWSSRFSDFQQQQDADADADAINHKVDPTMCASQNALRLGSDTSSGEVSQAVSVVHDRPPRLAPFLADSLPSPGPSRLAQVCDGSEVDQAYEDWAAMHHARGAVSEDAEASIDNLLQRRQRQKTRHMQKLAQFDTLGTSGASTPTIWTAHFPAAQLRPY